MFFFFSSLNLFFYLMWIILYFPLLSTVIHCHLFPPELSTPQSPLGNWLVTHQARHLACPWSTSSPNSCVFWRKMKVAVASSFGEVIGHQFEGLYGLLYSWIHLYNLTYRQVGYHKRQMYHLVKKLFKQYFWPQETGMWVGHDAFPVAHA